MNKKKLLSVISKLPKPINSTLTKLNIYPELVFGKKYLETRQKFFENPTDRFLTFFKETTKNNKFYKKYYNIDTLEITSIEDFKKAIPYIDKDMVLEWRDDFLSDDHMNADICTTGGTSGKPLAIHLPKSRYANELGSLHALWSKIGYDFSTRAVIRNERFQGQDYIINPITKEYIFDGFRSEADYQAIIYKTMKRHKIRFLHGYTSNLERFASYLLSNNLDYSFIDGLISSSENLYDHQIHLFSKLDGVQHMNFYGHSEKLILGGWCETGKCYHFYNSYGFAELIDKNGNEVTKTGELGELVGSTNYNTFMPLFRYRTGDYAEKAPHKCAGCGFEGLSAYRIHGRWNGERIYNSDGSSVSTTALNLHSDQYEHIDALQYYQKAPGELVVRVVPSETFNQSIERSLLSEISSKFYSTTKISIEKVSEVQRNKNGKYQLLIKEPV